MRSDLNLTNVTDTIGDTSAHNSGFNTTLWASKITASQSGVIVTIGMNMYASSGNMRLKLYADSSGVPGALLCETNSTAMATGWNDIAPTSLPSIVSGTPYWLALEVDNSTAAPYYTSTTGNYHITHTYGAGPNPFGSGTGPNTPIMNLRMTYNPTVAKNVSDVGAGADTLQQAIPGSDTGSGVETPTSSVTFGISDSGTGSDSPSEEMDFLDNAIGGESPIWPTLQISDAGVGSDAETSSVTFSVGDSGSGTDNPVEWMYYNDVSNRVHVVITATLFDVGFGVELITIGIGGSDVGTGTDAATPQVTVTDAGTGVEVLGLRLTMSDLGSGRDTTVLQATFGVSDVGTGSDVATFNSSFNAAETGHGSEAATFNATLGLADSGVGTDVLVSQATLSVGDSGSGADNPVEWMYLNDQSNRIHVPGAVFVNDFGTGTDLVAFQVTFQVADVGSGMEVATFNVTFNTTDSGLASEAFITGVLTSDSGSGSEATTFQASFAVGDAGSGVEAATEGLRGYDSGSGSETPLTLQVSLTVNDVVRGVELFGKAFTAFDSGFGSEAYARVFFIDVADGVSGSERFAIRVLRSGRLQYIVRLSVTENVFDLAVFDPYSFE